MLQKIRIPAVILLLALFTFQASALESAVLFKNFTTEFSASWYIHDNGGTPKIRVTLLYVNYDITGWPGSTNGLWMGIGFGSATMINSDVITCMYFFPGFAVCEDRYSTAHERPELDSTTSDVELIDNHLYQNNVGNRLLGTFEVTFDKPLSTGDATQDYILTPGSMVDIIWAQGLKVSTNMGIH